MERQTPEGTRRVKRRQPKRRRVLLIRWEPARGALATLKRGGSVLVEIFGGSVVASALAERPRKTPKTKD